MNIEQIKDEFKRISLAHIDIEAFSYGEVFVASNAGGGDNNYPMSFLEIPYLEAYDLTSNRFKTLNFSLNIFIQTPQDDVEAGHQAISDAEQIGEAIITRIQNELPKSVSFDTITALSLREFSDDDLAGMRFEFIVRIIREFCDQNSYADKFRDC